jgi:hypothetical protein
MIFFVFEPWHIIFWAPKSALTHSQQTKEVGKRSFTEYEGKGRLHSLAIREKFSLRNDGQRETRASTTLRSRAFL